jgi:hypothetical protein
MSSNPAKFDENMRVVDAATESCQWHDPREKPFRLNGLAWFGTEGKYRRMPTVKEGALPPGVDCQADQPSGVRIYFKTDSTALAVRVKLRSVHNMNHMPATGQCGVDCYFGGPGNWRFAGVTKYDRAAIEYQVPLYADLPQEMREVVLNLPLYKEIDSIEIGLAPGAKIEAPSPFAVDGGVVVYGSSITQGGCASRPGMNYTNILSRLLNIDCINQGYSGSGRGEPEVAETLAKIKNPACHVLDFVANCGDPEVYVKRLPEFIRILRAVHPLVPILVLSRISYNRDAFRETERKQGLATAKISHDEVNRRKATGDMNIYYLDMGDAFGEDFDECTVDGVHPTDLGFYRMAKKVEPALRLILL